jgi:hypothetical protein
LKKFQPQTGWISIDLNEKKMATMILADVVAMFCLSLKWAAHGALTTVELR